LLGLTFEYVVKSEDIWELRQRVGDLENFIQAMAQSGQIKRIFEYLIVRESNMQPLTIPETKDKSEEKKEFGAR
jgi:hypothetical protein